MLMQGINLYVQADVCYIPSPKISNVGLLKQSEFSKICLELVDISPNQKLQITYFL